ncbi:MAG: type II toxin-antitoxin system HigB family toxin [Aulosira sp. ZfuVER01]|nr:type II toxin-antitoxin system HigB family toxin [Aulosira sp. ZfuVER01]MDZ8001468.1 type II toxin-antitoxin system HigB family toxin [Aulosira sp. DedVER01a]MDZ8051664.1 type II toxin-antitoxin system HigB family toxin [Aulosira sp. ZfuCHP01]
MHVITRSRLIEFWEKHPDSKTSLLLWYKLTITASWQNFVDLREVFSSADQVGNFTVFNIGGNKYRLIAFIDYTYQKVFIRNVLTHAEYDKDDWKKDEWYGS